MTPINFLHDPLCPADRIRDCGDRGRNPRSTVELREFTCCEDARGNEQNTLAPLIHAQQITIFAFSSLWGYTGCDGIHSQS